jgi:hypothetical protein
MGVVSQITDLDNSSKALPYNFAVTLCRVYDDRLFCTVMYDGDARYRTPKNRMDKPFSAPCTIKTVIDGGVPQAKQKKAHAPDKTVNCRYPLSVTEKQKKAHAPDKNGN